MIQGWKSGEVTEEELKRSGLGVRLNRRSTEDFKGKETICMVLFWWTHVITHLSKPIKCITPRVNPNLHYGLRVIMMHQCRFISSNKCSALGGWMLIMGEAGYACAGGGGRREISVPSIQFY